MSTITSDLKYLWTAYFEDGSSIQQPPDDRYSKHDEEAEYNPSAFRDVLDAQAEKKLVAFTITNIENGQNVALVLEGPEAGCFYVNGLKVEIQDQNFSLQGLTLDLIFFREVRKDFHPGEDEPYNEYVNRYFIGWKVLDPQTMKVEQRTMAIS